MQCPVQGTMVTRHGRLALPACLLATCFSASMARAHAPRISLSGIGTATVDGVMSPGEWNGAAHADFVVDVPAADGGGTTLATLYVMNDESNLYVAVRIKRPSLGGANSVFFEFDNDHDGVREDGDDAFGASFGGFPATFWDDYRYTCPGATPGSAGCAPSDTDSLAGFPPPGTRDGGGAAANDGNHTYVEESHPLDSGDRPHDFDLQAGDTVGFMVPFASSPSRRAPGPSPTPTGPHACLAQGSSATSSSPAPAR